jgi:phosphatidylglycerophosphate synthase
VIRQGVLYFSSIDDVRAALRTVAGQPVAFRALMTAVQAGVARVAVPRVLRDSALAVAIARTPAARAATVWLEDDASPPTEGMLLLPAATLVPAAALARIAHATSPAVLAESRAEGAPVVVAAPSHVRALWNRLVAGAPVGGALERAFREETVTVRPGGGGCVRVTTPDAARRAQALLSRDLSSPIDSRLDRAFQRRLSRPVTWAALALGLGPNQVTLASLLAGLVAAWCVWLGRPWSLATGLILYVVAVVLDHADGEVARLTHTESVFGDWLDLAADTAVHAAMVMALGLVAERVSGGGAAVWGGVAAAGVTVNAALVKRWPLPAVAVGVAAVLRSLANRNGFYGVLAAFGVGLGLIPSLLWLLVMAVALGTHAYWLGHLACRLAGPLRASSRGTPPPPETRPPLPRSWVDDRVGPG